MRLDCSEIFWGVWAFYSSLGFRVLGILLKFRTIYRRVRDIKDPLLGI